MLVILAIQKEGHCAHHELILKYIKRRFMTFEMFLPLQKRKSFPHQIIITDESWNFSRTPNAKNLSRTPTKCLIYPYSNTEESYPQTQTNALHLEVPKSLIYYNLSKICQEKLRKLSSYA